MLPGPYNDNYQIFQSPGYVAIVVEMIHDVRIIPLDARPHLPSNVQPVAGRFARALGRQYAGDRNDEFHRTKRGFAGPAISMRSDRTFHAHRCGYHPL